MPSQPSQQSSQESDEPSRGRISRLDLFNFKSYGGKTSLGPFKDFSAVVGPNGAGSSRPPAPAPAPGATDRTVTAHTRRPPQASPTSWMR